MGSLWWKYMSWPRLIESTFFWDARVVVVRLVGSQRGRFGFRWFSFAWDVENGHGRPAVPLNERGRDRSVLPGLSLQLIGTAGGPMDFNIPLGLPTKERGSLKKILVTYLSHHSHGVTCASGYCWNPDAGGLFCAHKSNRIVRFSLPVFQVNIVKIMRSDLQSNGGILGLPESTF